ncbi:MAG: tRNA lysidine(34) synthetase TilS [Micropruina sp.]|nr:tRNA lysidine(34) synthetase TilS [Micropruina sp.]
MARRALGAAGLAVLQAVQAAHDRDDLMVACSGGADSLALALAARVLAERAGCRVRAVVVDHGLQPGSAAHSAQVAERLGTLGLPAQVVAVSVQPTGEGPEAAAREARYRALDDALAPGERCYLGHTLDDQAETVLLGLARGSGLRSLAGMPVARDSFVRPLLGLRRAITRQSCLEQNLTWWDDPHNAESRFSRVRVRGAVLPVLESELGPGVAEALARTADLARDDADALDALALNALAASREESGRLSVTGVSGLPAALRHRVLRLWLRAHGAGELTRAHVLAVAALVTDWHGQKWVEVPGLRVRRSEGELRAVQHPAD